MFMKMYDEKKKKDAETNKSNQIKSNSYEYMITYRTEYDRSRNHR